MEIKRDISKSGTTYRIMNDGNPLFFPVYTIEYRMEKLMSFGLEYWEREPTGFISSNRQETMNYFNELINV